MCVCGCGQGRGAAAPGVGVGFGALEPAAGGGGAEGGSPTRVKRNGEAAPLGISLAEKAVIRVAFSKRL